MTVFSLPIRAPRAAVSERVEPRRFWPQSGRKLTLDVVRGPWRPSGTVAGAGVFAVVWSTRRGDFWAAVHDFEPADQLRLIDMVRRLDLEQYGVR